jgi:DNA-directed RNA polymerase II subunit RPB1
LADRGSPDFAKAAAIRNGKKRLLAMQKLCRTRGQCKGSNYSTKSSGDATGQQESGVFAEEQENKMIKHEDHGCGTYQPNFRRDGLRILCEFKEEHAAENNVADRKQIFSAESAYNILSRVSDDDIRLLGLDPVYARPEWMIVTVLPVAPPHVRPSVAIDSITRADDDITHKYADVVKANITVANAKKSGQPAVVVQQYENVLAYHVATLIDNSLPGLPNATQRGGKALKTFRERLVGKGGRVRGNLMGKRVDFSARTVITADPILSIHQVGVPRSIAANLTIPVRVNRYNMRQLQAMVERGPFEHPGVKYIIRDNGVRIDLRYAKSAADLTLKYGYIVERHLMDDDVVLFNRQPTLHKMSIMCHRAKVLDYSTFRLNLTCTTPYNADFDGDEMNLHALQTLPAIAEASELMIVPRLIITAQANRPVMGIVQDTLLGSRLFTARDVFLSRDFTMNCIMWMGNWDGRMPLPAVMTPKRKGNAGVTLWTGKQLFSMIIPDVNYTCTSQETKSGWKFEDMYPDDGQVIIDKGTLYCGMLDKASLGNRGNSLLHVIMNDVTPEDCRDFINTTQRVVNYWLLHRGFSIGIGDAESSTTTMGQVSKAIGDAKEKVKSMLQSAQQKNGLKRQPGQTMIQNFESLVNEVLNQARSQASKAVSSVMDERSNSVLAMVNAGSKGSANNISQIIALVGQQNVEGKRIPYGFRDRTLPHFTKFDLGPTARGFVENSYLKGLEPSEFFFHMMGGREGLIDTAVKTAETGYIQRRLVKAMEDVMVRYDGTVRNSCNEVVQFLYGEDGMDARWVENNDLPSYKLSMSALRDKYEWRPDIPTFGRVSAGREIFLDPEVLEEMRRNDAVRDALAREFSVLLRDREIIADLFSHMRKVDKDITPMALAISRMITNAKRKFRIASDGVSDLHPVRDVIDPLNALLNELIVVPGSHPLSVEAQANATSLLQAALRSHLASRRVIEMHRLTREAFSWLLGEIRTRFNGSVVAPGEMCGVLAAQSLGEPATQMTLNTFHHAGVSAKNVTLGMPRLKELINVAKKIRTPSLTIFVNEQLQKDEKAALDRLQQVLEYITLADLVEESRILYDPDPATSVVEEDKYFVEIYAISPDEGVNLDSLSPWVLRLRFSRELMGNRLIRLNEIKSKIKALDPTLDVVDSGENALIPVLRIRMSNATRAAAATTAEGTEADDTGAGISSTSALGVDAVVARDAAGATGEDDERALREFEGYLLNELPLRGIPGVRKLFKSEHKGHVWTQDAGVVPAPKEPKFETEGSNLRAVLNLPEVDFPRTFCNDVIEIFSLLGIEACRKSLLNELRAVIEFDGTYVNYRHMALLVDVMTFRGYLTAVTRHGINRVDTGPLIRSSFEETCEILMEAAIFAEVDEMRGASDNIMFGQMCPIGTGHCDILLDESRLLEAIPVDAVTQELEVSGSGMNAADAYGQTPMLVMSPSAVSAYPSQSAYSPGSGAAFSPNAFTPASSFSPGGGLSPAAMASPMIASMSPSAYASTYGDSMNSPAYGIIPQSPAFTPDDGGATEYSPTSVAPTPLSAAGSYGTRLSPTSPHYGAASASYAGSASVRLSPTSPHYSSSIVGGGASPRFGASPSSPACMFSIYIYIFFFFIIFNYYIASFLLFSLDSPTQGGTGHIGLSPTSPACTCIITHLFQVLLFFLSCFFKISSLCIF